MANLRGATKARVWEKEEADRMRVIGAKWD
jgi:hypothetical protein